MPVETVICPDNGARPLVVQLGDGTDLQTALATSKIALFQQGMITLTQNTTLADLQAAEATYDGYTTGGKTIATWGTPYVSDDGQSVLVTAPSQQFDYVDGTTHVSNVIAGAFIVDSTSHLRGACLFDTPVTMSADDNAVVVSFTFRLV